MAGDAPGPARGPAQNAETRALLEAVQKLHSPIEVDVMATACAAEDCDHGDADDCLAACSKMATCDHCHDLRWEARQWDEYLEVQAWPCPTAKLWIDADA